MLKEFYPKVLHVAADGLSRLDMTDNPNDELEWEHPSLHPDIRIKSEKESNYHSP